MKARELLPQTAYDYYASGANDEITLRAVGQQDGYWQGPLYRRARIARLGLDPLESHISADHDQGTTLPNVLLDYFQTIRRRQRS